MEVGGMVLDAEGEQLGNIHWVTPVAVAPAIWYGPGGRPDLEQGQVSVSCAVIIRCRLLIGSESGIIDALPIA
jgi:hypothetical protein